MTTFDQVHREQKEAEKEGADVLPPLVLWSIMWSSKICEISWRQNFGVLILEYGFGWSKVQVLLLWDETMKSSCMDAASNILHQSSCKSPTCKKKKGLSLSNVIFRLFCHKSPPPFIVSAPNTRWWKIPLLREIIFEGACETLSSMHVLTFFSDLPPPATMSEMENFHLARNDFDACTRNTFKNLWQDGEVFAGVTLAWRDK